MVEGRAMSRVASFGLPGLLLALVASLQADQLRPKDAGAARPNILFAVADDWSYGHAGAYRCRWVQTTGFDRVARDGRSEGRRVGEAGRSRVQPDEWNITSNLLCASTNRFPATRCLCVGLMV